MQRSARATLRVDRRACWVQTSSKRAQASGDTCTLPTEFARNDGHIQQYFIDHKIRILLGSPSRLSHRRSRGETRFSQLAFTLRQWFYLRDITCRAACTSTTSRLTFVLLFERNGSRILPDWTRWPGESGRGPCADKYCANERFRHELKYSHFQTSGRCLPREETPSTTSALRCRRSWHCRTIATHSHTNAYDEGDHTAHRESVRRALAIQLVITKSSACPKNENPTQGSFVVED